MLIKSQLFVVFKLEKEVPKVL